MKVFVIKIRDRFFYEYKNKRINTAWSLAGAKLFTPACKELEKLEKVFADKKVKFEKVFIKVVEEEKKETTKPVLNDGFVIDFFELMFLAESVIPERPIARSMCFDDFSERHYHKMNDNQRLQFFEHVQKCDGFTLENEQCRHFFARFNPKNQYLVSCFHNGKAETIQCYMFGEEYRTSKNRFVNRDYIKSVLRMHDCKIII